MNNNDEIYLNDVVMEEKFEIQPNCIFKEESGKMIIAMHYVGHFIV